MIVIPKLLLLAFQFIREIFRIRGGVGKAVLSIGVTVNPDREDISHALSFEAVGPFDRQRGISALYIIAVKSIRCEIVFTRNDHQVRRTDRHARSLRRLLWLQFSAIPVWSKYIASPQFNEQNITEKANVLRSGRRYRIRLSRYIQ